jgi:hypothetical protein
MSRTLGPVMPWGHPNLLRRRLFLATGAEALGHPVSRGLLSLKESLAKFEFGHLRRA